MARLNKNARKWVKALLSGEFTQGNGALRINDKYCCLGVACEVYRRETGKGEWKKTKIDGEPYEPYVFITENECDDETLPFVVRDWLGLEFCNGLTEDTPERSLTDFNDNGGSFQDIADFISRRPKGLFASSKKKKSIDLPN